MKLASRLGCFTLLLACSFFGCSSGGGSPNNNDDGGTTDAALAFVGTWLFTGGGGTRQCINQSTQKVTSNIVWQGQVAITATGGGNEIAVSLGDQCWVNFSAGGSSAAIASGQTCAVNAENTFQLDYPATISFTSGTLTLVDASHLEIMLASNAVMKPGYEDVSCALTETGSATK